MKLRIGFFAILLLAASMGAPNAARADTRFECPGGGFYFVDGGVLTGTSGSCRGDLVIDDTVTEISSYAFWLTLGLSSVSIPSSVQKIDQGAFMGNLFTSLKLSEGLETIGDYAFLDVPISALVLPSSLTAIGESAFMGTLITSLHLNNGLESIGTYAFGSIVTDTALDVTIPDSVTSLGASAFENSTLGNVRIGNGVSTISAQAFYNNYGVGVKSLIFGSSVSAIEDAAFVGYRGSTIRIPASVTSIGSRAFEGTRATALIFTPDSGLTYMQRNAFKSGALETVVYCPVDGSENPNVQTFGYYRFDDYAALTPVCETIPDAPAISGVTAASATSASIAYTAPLNDGGGVINSYTATSTPGSFSASVSGAESGSIIVAGLTYGVTYTFTVVATNLVGDSSASLPSTSFVMALPVAITSPSSSTSFNGTVGSPFSLDVHSQNGLGSRTTSISSGTLPDGVNLDASTGVISGTPTTSGTSIFSISVADSGSPVSTATVTNISIVISNGPKIDTPVPTTGTVTPTTATISFGAIAHASSYTLRLYANDGTTLIGSPIPNFISGSAISGLNGSTSYKVTVTAIADSFSYGDSLESSPVSFLTTTPPPPPPPSFFNRIEYPKISQTPTQIICTSGRFIFFLHGSGGETAVPTSQTYSLIADGKNIATTKSLQTSAGFSKADLNKGATYTCTQTISELDASETFTTVNFSLQYKVQQDLRAETNSSRAIYWTSIKLAMDVRRKSIDELIQTHQAHQIALAASPSLRTKSASESMKLIVATWHIQRDLLEATRKSADEAAHTAELASLEKAGISLVL
jgi:hypothetical protein